ncbi:MAG: hypothetical protein ACRCV6_06205 [Formosimonas sp.]
MRLLNLWPNATAQKIAPQTQLKREILLTVLLVVALSAGADGYVRAQLSKAQAVNALLNQQLQAMPAVSAIDDEAAAWVARRRAGQLNWLAALPVMTDGHVRLLHVDSPKEGVLILGRADSATAAHQALQKLKQALPQTEVLMQSLEHKADGWHFVLNMPQTLLKEGQ